MKFFRFFLCRSKPLLYICTRKEKMVVVAQLVRVLVCGAEGRRFEPGQPPRFFKSLEEIQGFFCALIFELYIGCVGLLLILDVEFIVV